MNRLHALRILASTFLVLSVGSGPIPAWAEGSAKAGPDAELATRCASGDGGACLAAAMDAMMSRRSADALAAARKGCELGVADACALKVMLEGAESDDPDMSAARQEMQGTCESGSVFGCTFLGLMLAQGQGGDPDTARAEVLLNDACNGGVAFACVALADVVRVQGPEGELRARILMEGQCERGYLFGCYAAFDMHVLGMGGEGEPGRVLGTVAGFCEKGSAASCVLVARMVDRVELELPADLDLRGRLERGCSEGHSEACAYHASMCEKGEGGAADVPRAIEGYERACAGGVDWACKRGKKLQER